MKITIECMHMFLVQLYAYMSVFPVWFNIRVMKMSQNNNLFVTNDQYGGNSFQVICIFIHLHL